MSIEIDWQRVEPRGTKNGQISVKNIQKTVARPATLHETAQDCVLRAIENGHRNAVAIAKATGMTYDEVRDTITRLRTLGAIEHDLSGCGTYRLRSKCLLADVWK